MLGEVTVVKLDVENVPRPFHGSGFAGIEYIKSHKEGRT